MQKPRFFLLIFLIFFLFHSFHWLSSQAPAYALNPGSYFFRFTQPQSTASSSQKTGQNSSNPILNPNYTITAGFPHTQTINDFNFTISNTSIDFAILSPETPITKTNTLSISAPYTRGYSVLAYQNHPLQLSSVNSIPDLTSSDSYGFGYSLTSSDQPQAFPDQSQHQPPLTLLSSSSATTDTAIITYQVNIPPTQAAGDYANTIFFLAIPAF